MKNCFSSTTKCLDFLQAFHIRVRELHLQWGGLMLSTVSDERMILELSEELLIHLPLAGWHGQAARQLPHLTLS